MWFKNLQLFRFTSPFQLAPEQLEALLRERAFHPCGSLEPQSVGWTAPLGRKAEQLVHVANGYLMISACRQEKVLPPAVVHEIVSERAAEIEDQQMRRLRKAERDNLRSEVLHELMPRAFSRTLRTFAYLAPRDGWLVVDAASRKRAEELTVLLRQSLGSLPVAPPASVERPAAIMTGWLAEEAAPEDFVLESECELRDPKEDGGIVRCRRQDLATPEIQAHLKAGKEASQLALTWNERISFVLDEAFSIKRLRFLDVVQDQAAEVETEDEAARFDVDFSIMTLELAHFLPRLFEAFGGEDVKAPTSHDASASTGLPTSNAA